jgi:glycine cleavage system regulatory protein
MNTDEIDVIAMVLPTAFRGLRTVIDETPRKATTDRLTEVMVELTIDRRAKAVLALTRLTISTQLKAIDFTADFVVARTEEELTPITFKAEREEVTRDEEDGFKILTA